MGGRREKGLRLEGKWVEEGRLYLDSDFGGGGCSGRWCNKRFCMGRGLEWRLGGVD